MSNLFVLWNWPKSVIVNQDIETVSKISGLNQGNKFCILSNHLRSISGWNDPDQTIDACTFTKPIISDLSESSILGSGVSDILPSSREMSYILENIIFCDRLVKNVWSKDIIKRFWLALSHCESSPDSYLVFVSNGIYPTVENFGSEFNSILGGEIAKGCDLLIFRDVNGVAFKNLFVIKASLLRSIFTNISFEKGGGFDQKFANVDPEGFLEMCYRRSNSASVLSSHLLLKIFSWSPQDFDVSINNTECDKKERIPVLKSLCLNSIFLCRNQSGNFDLSHVFCNLNQGPANFSVSLVQVKGQSRISIHQREQNLSYREWKVWKGIMEIIPSSDSYLEVTLKTNYLDLSNSEFFTLSFRFEDLYAFSALRYYYEKTT